MGATFVTYLIFRKEEDEMRTIALVVIVSFLTSGCAAMFHGTNETIYVRSEEPDTVFFCKQS